MTTELKTVFVVLEGEKYEGGEVRSVHLTKEGAVAAARKSLSSGWRDGWKTVGSTGDTRWESGCDFVEVSEHEVLP